MKVSKYYQEKQIIPRVDETGKIIGEIEKWDAHKNGVLHRGYSIALVFQGKFILQHRRHPAFDGTYDLTTSSHQLLINRKFETLNQSAIKAVRREWNNVKLTGEPENLGSVYYKASDPKSIYTEHEICDILEIEVKEVPTPNFEFSYGFSLITKEELKNKKSRIYENLSPWTKKTIEEGLLD